jgi:hypothetical protein
MLIAVVIELNASEDRRASVEQSSLADRNMSLLRSPYDTRFACPVV